MQPRNSECFHNISNNNFHLSSSAPCNPASGAPTVVEPSPPMQKQKRSIYGNLTQLGRGGWLVLLGVARGRGSINDRPLSVAGRTNHPALLMCLSNCAGSPNTNSCAQHFISIKYYITATQEFLNPAFERRTKMSAKINIL